jgi:hypothetical protein
MLTNLLIAGLLAVAIVALLGWFGDWSGQQHRSRVEKVLASRKCLECSAAYGPKAAAASHWTVESTGPISRAMKCPNCSQIREWREDGRPMKFTPDLSEESNNGMKS